MGTRLELQTLLESVQGVSKVYFQPPENLKLVYPCIVYELSGDSVIHADNANYLRKKAYTLAVIDRNPDSQVAEEVSKFDFCRFERTFSSSNLVHFQYKIFY